MRRLILFSIVFFLPCFAAHATPQQTPEGVNPKGIVESAGVSGVDSDEISKDLRDAIQQLAGKPYDQNAADELIVRIQAENPAFTATARLTPGSDSNSVKLLFAIQKNTAESSAGANVNSRYTVERVDIEGPGQSRVSQAIRDQTRKMVGEKLDQEKADQILHEMNRQLQPRYSAAKKVRKGSDPQHVILVYEIDKARVIPFVDVPAQRIVYHSKENFSGDFNAQFVEPWRHNNRLIIGIADDQDQLIERFAGFNFGFESTNVGTDHLGLALRYARYHDRWQPETVAADRGGIYRERNIFEPAVTFGLDPHLRVSAGLSLSEMQIQYPATHDANAGAFTGSVGFHNVWADATQDRHKVEAGYDVRAGSRELDSDFIYTRHLLHAQYVYRVNRNQLSFSFAGGTISGNAPLFERFSLGDTSTLRGWSKFDVAPAGGNRMLYGSVQYGFGKPSIGQFNSNTDKGVHVGEINLGFHIFYDTGAVGNAGTPIVAKHSVGFGIGGRTFFMELGFPIRSSRVEPVFSMGFRF